MVSLLALTVLILHAAVIIFNVGGLIIIPLGAWRGWAFVRVFWWRALHLASLVIVAIQAVFGQACFLTVWENALRTQAGQTVEAMPLVARWVNDLIYWPLPLWVFAVIYIAVCAYALFLWRWVPPRRSTENKTA